MRLILTTIVLFLIFSCTENKQSERIADEQVTEGAEQPQEVDKKEEVIEVVEPALEKKDYAQIDSTIRGNIEKLDKRHGSTPFYVRQNGANFYIICSGKHNYQIERFNGTLKYGLVDDSLRVLLEPIFDKIHNPNLTIENCFEIEKEDKVGLFNFKTGEILSPQFDYILPSNEKPDGVAFGYKGGQWFKIESNTLSIFTRTDFNPSPILRTLSFNVLNLGDNMMFDSYWKYYEDDANVGRGVVLPPSYISHLGLLDRDYTDIILPEQEGRIDFGRDEARVNTTYRRTLSDKLMAFFVSIYESGVDARGYQKEAKQLILYNEESNAVNSIQLGTLDTYDYFCGEASYRFVNDSIVEVKDNNRGRNQRYEFETVFKYHKVQVDGTVVPLTSNRYYDFTKYIIIDENNLKGCFAWELKDPQLSKQYNMWVTDHLSMEDLDIMRNEIFAEYGLKFKTEKWQKYFAKQTWYRPRYDDVNDQLTEIDKANIKLILEIKDRMKADEEAFINKRPSRYVAAG